MNAVAAAANILPRELSVATDINPSKPLLSQPAAINALPTRTALHGPGESPANTNVIVIFSPKPNIC